MLATLIGLCGATPPAWSGIQVSPVRIVFTPRDRIVTVTLGNDGAREVTVQAETLRWSQGPNGADVLEPTDEVVASPPLLKLAPGARKVIRLARLRRHLPEQELSYRLLVHELPSADAPAEKALNLRFTFTFSVPIFVAPRAPMRDVRCQPAPDFASVTCRNEGNTFARVRRLSLFQGEAELATSSPAAYLLPGTAKVLPIKAQAPGARGPARLLIELEDGTTQAHDAALP
ncbi:fimbria/pilus periplasmic chaperone [Ramlibacter sp. AN1015]|uniref:fimbrial biogenesis chaperone n=1 Tax=Ramlibacter sp. AN1015 TaxID=3133428 RepID=UPI0030BD86C7